VENTPRAIAAIDTAAEASKPRFRNCANISSADSSASEHAGLRRRRPNAGAEPRLHASSPLDTSVWLRSSPRRPTQSYYRELIAMTTSCYAKSVAFESPRNGAGVRRIPGPAEGWARASAQPQNGVLRRSISFGRRPTRGQEQHPRMGCCDAA
jgi:hypothetical protein